MSTPLTILSICGSLRQGSFNRMALLTAQKLTPSDAKLEIFDRRGMPPFHQDDKANPPAEVADFNNGILAADAILLTPRDVTTACRAC
jgi:chromate reductase